MMGDRLQELQQRMLRNYLTTGIGMIIVSPGIMLLPLAFSFYLALIVLVLGILSVVRASILYSNSKKPPPPPA